MWVSDINQKAPVKACAKVIKKSLAELILSACKQSNVRIN